MPPFLLSIIGFFAGPLGKLAMYAIAGLTAAGILTGAYLSWKHSVEEAVVARAEVAQLKQTVVDQEDTIKKQKDLMKIQANVSQKLDDDVTVINNGTRNVSDWIASPEAKKTDRPASIMLKGTLKKLGATQ